MKRNSSEDHEHEDSKATPKSIKTTKKDIHLKKLSTIMANLNI